MKIVKSRPKGSSCLKWFRAAKLQGKNMICAGNTDDNHRDVCSGDSGGALACLQNDKIILTGITSYGVGCGNYKNHPSFYTRVTYYLDWIKQYMVKV